MAPPATGDAGLIVIGCGPTGIAGLYQAALEGIPAFGIEAGPAPLASVLNYMDGLVLASPAYNYEIGGLPLDCRAVDWVTREDLLHYFGRMITFRRLKILCRTRCIGLRPRGDHVEVLVDRAGKEGVYRAERVLVTSWYRRRPPSPDVIAADGEIPIYSTLRNPAQLAGRNVVILGGGMSAGEFAKGLMLNGQRIVLLARGEPRPMIENPRFRRLVEATSSSVWYRVSRVAADSTAVSFVQGGAEHVVPCDAIVAAIGQELQKEVLAMLLQAGVLTGQEIDRLRSAKSYEELVREFPLEDAKSVMKRAAVELPDLREHVFQGRHGIHLAGGALHVGSSNAGVMYSIFTAILAVRAMAGHPPPEGAEMPLPEYFSELDLPEEVPASVAFERVASLHPLHTGLVRNAVSLDIQENGLGHQVRADRRETFSTSSKIFQEDPEIGRVLAAADGTISVAGLAARFGMETGEERELFWKLLRYLWWNGALTWLPPPTRHDGDYLPSQP